MVFAEGVVVHGVVEGVLADAGGEGLFDPVEADEGEFDFGGGA